MRKIILSLVLGTALSAPALAGSYPVNGRWGESVNSEKGAIDCAGKRVMAFDGNQRHDSNSGVPDYRNESVTNAGTSRYRVVDTFANAQVSNGRTEYTLRQVDDDHIELQTQSGSIKLQRCR